MADPNSLRFDHFEVLRKADGTPWELGRGGMGVTYKAFDTRLQVDVVLKLPHEQLMSSERGLRLFLREARAAAKVRHPNIASVIHLHDQAPLYYVMEFVGGQPLDALLRARKTLPLGEALDLLDQIASALHALAGAQIVHRDLKPANLVLLPDDDRPFGRTAKLIDFGLAKGFAGGSGRGGDVSAEQPLASRRLQRNRGLRQSGTMRRRARIGHAIRSLLGRRDPLADADR